MADPVLHIKDSYYFEVPKVLYPYEYKSRKQFPDVWVSLDPEYQEWEFARLYADLQGLGTGLPPKNEAQHDWEHWVHADHANFAKPFDVFLEEKYQAHVAAFNTWKQARVQEAQKKNDGSDVEANRLLFGDYVNHLQSEHTADAPYLDFLKWRHTSAKSFEQAKAEASNVEEWKHTDTSVAEWSDVKLKAYNNHLSGKILIPQPFATLRNLYEKESGFAISKYMLIEVFVGLVLVVVFAQFAKRIEHGRPAKGKLWNLLETFLVFIRDQIANPILGSHDHGHSMEHNDGHHEPAHHHHAAEAHRHGHASAHHEPHANPAAKFLPLLWTIFFFVLGCNLMGMVPWAGAPTAAWGVTLALAVVTFGTVWVFGMIQFGVTGFFLNQIPSIELGRPDNVLLRGVAIVFETFLKIVILAIELLGLCIKHAVLSIRLLANMVAGHLVILGVMGLAFGAQAALYYSDPQTPGWQWWVTATIAVIGAAAFSVLELFVAFLQAYIFAFLSALFIGAAIHKH